LATVSDAAMDMGAQLSLQGSALNSFRFIFMRRFLDHMIILTFKKYQHCCSTVSTPFYIPISSVENSNISAIL
jgi:hypothetical protein